MANDEGSQLSSHDEFTKFPRLAALAKLVSEGIHIGEHHLETEQTIAIFQRYRVLEDFNSCVEEASKTQVSWTEDSKPLNVPKFARTDWKDDAPSKAFDRLHQTLLAHAEFCESDRHEILLKMVGARFEQMTFDAIVIPCDNQEKLVEARFSAEDALGLNHNQPRTFVHSLCRTVESLENTHPLMVPNFIFDGAGKTKLRYIPSEGFPNPEISVDTTLKFLQEQRYLSKPYEGGIFETEDKTVLELVLAQSLLHLLRSPWTELPWCSTSIKFLRNLQSDELIDVHRPYAAYLLKPRLHGKSTLNQFAETMTSFARLLLEIESGRAVEMGDSKCTDTHRVNIQLYAEMNRREQNYEVRGLVKHAVENCLKFKAILDDVMHKTDSEIEHSSDYYIRKALYEKVIHHLENNLAAIENHRDLFRQLNLRMPHRPVETSVLQDGIAEPPEIVPSIPAAESRLHIVAQVQRDMKPPVNAYHRMNRVTMFDSSESTE